MMKPEWRAKDELEHDAEAQDAFVVWWVNGGGRPDDIKRVDDRTSMGYVAFCAGFKSGAIKAFQEVANDGH